MKKLFFATIFTLSCISTFYGQGKGDVEFGFNLGFNSSTMVVSDSYAQPASGNGLNVGFTADYYFSERWSIKAKLIYDQKGWNNGFYEDAVVEYITDYNLDYITLPVMASWHFGNKREWYLNFGPYAGFLLSAKETTGGLDVKEVFNTSDFGLAYGIGLKVPVSDKLKIYFEYDGQSGFSNAFKESNGVNVFNSRASLNVGINFLMK